MHTPLTDQSPERSQHPSRGRRRGTALGVATGVLGGGLVGLLLTLPGLTNAATDSTSTTEPAAAVVVADSDTTDTSDTTDATDMPAPDPGARLREALQPLVDDGTITAAQADAVAEHLASSMPMGRGPGHHDRVGRGGQVVADALGIDVETLRTELRAGKTIAEIAGEQGVDVQAVIDALVAEATDHINQAVTDGRLTQEEADARLADLTEKITDHVNNGGGPLADGPHGDGPFGGGRMGGGPRGPMGDFGDADDTAGSGV